MSHPKTTRARPSRPDAVVPLLPPLRTEFSGRLSYDETVAYLEDMYFSNWSALRCIAGKIIEIPEIEAKVFFAHTLYLHSEVAASLRRRLVELRVRESRLAQIPPGTKRSFDELLASEQIVDFVQGYRTIFKEQLAKVERYEGLGDPILDRPTLSIMRRFLPDLNATALWLDAACNAYEVVRQGTGRLSHCTSEPQHTESIAAPGNTKQRGHVVAARSTECARDPRFALFTHTRAYGHGGELPDKQQDRYETDRLELARTQRDEIDAIETFANVLFDLEQLPFALVEQISRFVEDEARHVEAGHALLSSLGYDPFSLPCSIIGINVRAPMPPLLAFAQLNVFGELNIVSKLNHLASRAYARGDVLSAKAFDFIHADELTHVRRGRKLLRELAGSVDPDEVVESARRLAAQRLAEEGVMGEEYALSLSRKEIGELIGE